MIRTWSPIPRPGKKKKLKKNLRGVSPKRAKINLIYNRLRREFLEKRPYCEWWLMENIMPKMPAGTTMDELQLLSKPLYVKMGDIFTSAWIVPRSSEVHHKRKRGRYLLDVDTWMAVSHDAHVWIHNHPKESREKGYLY